jgi:hypothetical protein
VIVEFDRSSTKIISKILLIPKILQILIPDRITSPRNPAHPKIPNSDPDSNSFKS